MRVNSLFELSAIASVSRGRYAVDNERNLPPKAKNICDKIDRAGILSAISADPVTGSVVLLADGEYVPISSRYLLMHYNHSFDSLPDDRRSVLQRVQDHVDLITPDRQQKIVLLRVQEEESLSIAKIKLNHSFITDFRSTFKADLKVVLKKAIQDDDLPLFIQCFNFYMQHSQLNGNNDHFFINSFFDLLQQHQVTPNHRGSLFFPKNLLRYLFEQTSQKIYEEDGSVFCNINDQRFPLLEKDIENLEVLQAVFSITEGKVFEYRSASVEGPQRYVYLLSVAYLYGNTEMIDYILQDQLTFEELGLAIQWIFNQGDLAAWDNVWATAANNRRMEELATQMFDTLISEHSSDKSIPILAMLKATGYLQRETSISAILVISVQYRQFDLLQFMINHVQELHNNQYRTLIRDSWCSQELLFTPATVRGIKIGPENPDSSWEKQKICNLLLQEAYKEAIALGDQEVIELFYSTEMLKDSMEAYENLWRYSAEYGHTHLIDYLFSIDPPSDEKEGLLQKCVKQALKVSSSLMYKDLLLQAFPMPSEDVIRELEELI